MSTKQRAIKVCDWCGGYFVEGEGVYCHDVPHEGCSTIEHKGECFAVTSDTDYCSFKCLVEDLEGTLVLLARERKDNG
jgi:hypothetical protein